MATVPTPATQTAGLAVPAATINSQGNLATYLAGRVESGGARRPLAILRQTVAQTLTTATNSAITLDTEDVDYDNGHSTVTNTSRYTAGTAGWYFIRGVICYAANSTGERDTRFRVNGTSFVLSSDAVASAAASPIVTAIHASVHAFLNVGDYIELIGFQNSGGNLATQAGNVATSSGMSVQWVSV